MRKTSAMKESSCSSWKWVLCFFFGFILWNVEPPRPKNNENSEEKRITFCELELVKGKDKPKEGRKDQDTPWKEVTAKVAGGAADNRNSIVSQNPNEPRIFGEGSPNPLILSTTLKSSIQTYVRQGLATRILILEQMPSNPLNSQYYTIITMNQ